MSERGRSSAARGRGRGSQSGRSGQRSAQSIGGGRGHGRGRGRGLAVPSDQGGKRNGGRHGGRHRGRGRGNESNITPPTITRGIPPLPTSPPVILSDPPTPWGRSRAKKLARELLMDPDSWVQGMPATHVYYNHPLFEQYEKDNFANNYNSLQRTVKADKLAIEFDQLSITNDRKLHPRPTLTSKGVPFWDTHPAKFVCIAEIKSGAINGLTPEEVRERHTVYKAFPPPEFRQYLNMEKRHIREDVFWQAKRNKRARKRHEAQVATADT